MRAVFVAFILKFLGGKNKYISTENLFKIPQRPGVAKVPLVDLLKIHLGVEVDPQDGKSSRVCAKCALKIRNASTLCEFIRTALNCENTDEESQGEQRLKRMNIVSPQRNIKKRLQSSPSRHPYPGKTPRIYRQRKGRCSSSTQISSQKLRRYLHRISVILRETASTSEQSAILDFSLENPALLPPAGSPLLVENNQQSFPPFPSLKQNFDKSNSFQTQSEEPPKHLFHPLN